MRYRSYAWEIEHGFNHDIHDNLKDISGVQGSVDSSQAAAESQGANSNSQGFATGNLSASDEANISNSGNVTNNVIDPGAIAAASAIAETGLQDSSEAFQAANTTVQDALDKNSTLADQTQAGQGDTLAKTLGFVAAGLLGIYIVGKIIIAIFTGGGKRTE